MIYIYIYTYILCILKKYEWLETWKLWKQKYCEKKSKYDWSINNSPETVKKCGQCQRQNCESSKSKYNRELK